MNRYYFTYRLSGTDLNKKAIKDTASYSMNFRASTKALAEKKLRSTYYRSVKVEITAYTVIAEQ